MNCSDGIVADTVVSASSDGESLAWTVWLLRRERPLRSVVAVVVVVLSLYAGVHIVGNAFVVGLYAVVLLVAIGEFLFPVSYRLNRDGARATSWYGTVSIPWQRVRRLQRDSRGIKLSVYPRDTLLDRFRGMYLRFEDNADEVVAFARRSAGGGDDVQGSV